jgi:enoyl-CoA hydratase/carnithine racemase
MTGNEYSAEVFVDEGIVDEAVPADELEATATDFADRIGDRAPLAIRAIKDVVDNAREVGPRQGARYVTKAYLPLLETEDHERALEAAFEDRDIEFQGK